MYLEKYMDSIPLILFFAAGLTWQVALKKPYIIQTKQLFVLKTEILANTF